MAIILAPPLGVTRSARTVAEITLEEFIIPVGLTVDCQSVPPCGGVAANVLITQLPEVSTGKSRSPTSNILLRSVDTRKYATENCV